MKKMLYALLLSSCSPAPVRDIDFNEAAELTPQEEAKWERQRALSDLRYNENAEQINARLKANYERGSQVCRNLTRAGNQEGNGCPRPNPNYLPLRMSDYLKQENARQAVHQ